MNSFNRCWSLAVALLFRGMQTWAEDLASASYRLSAHEFVALGNTSTSYTHQLVGPIVGEPVGSASAGKNRVEVGLWAAVLGANDRLSESIALEDLLDQTVLHGEAADFYLGTPNLIGPVKFELRYDAETAGVVHAPIEFHAVTVGDAFFRYVPSPEDLEPFNLTIVATGADGTKDFTQFTVTPYPVLPQEEDLIQSSLPEPRAESRDYVTVSSEESAQPEDFNGQNQKTRKVAAIGKSLVLQRGNENGLVETFDQQSAQVSKLKHFNVIAEDVVMRDAIRVPGGHVTVFAKSFSAPGLDKPFGDAASVTIVTNATEWLQPEALRMMLAHVRDGYLNAFRSDRVQGIRQAVAEYLAEVQAVELSPRWNTLSEEARKEFGQERVEMESLLWSLDRNLDLFGNPAGWVPNLSFEVNLTFFNSEIEQAIKTLYLTQWLLNVTDNIQSRIAGMKQSQATLFAELESANTDLARLNVRLPELQAKAQRLAGELGNLQTLISQREEELRREAEAAANAKKKKNKWRKIASVAGSVLTVFPVGQPILGTVGTGLSIVSKLDRNSFSSPTAILDTFNQFKGVASAFTGANFTASITQTKDFLGGILKPLDPRSILPPTLPFEPGFMDYVKKVQDYYKGVKGSVNSVKDAIADIRKAAKAAGMSEEDALAALAQQRAENPEFNAAVRTADGRLNGLLDEVEKKFKEQRDLANEITEALLRISQLTEQIGRDILSIDAVNQSLAKANGAFDPRTATALKDMERRAQQRLLKYHYYLAKSYEARFQEPYNRPLDLGRFFNQLLTLAKTDPNGTGTLTQAQIGALAQVYQEALSDIVARIVDRFQQVGAGKRDSTSIRLSTAELGKLNRDEPLSINFVDRCRVTRDQEAIEINGVTMTMKVNGERLRDQTVRLRLEHSGVSKLKRGEHNWLFRHSSVSSSSPFRREHPFRWELKFDSNTEKFGATQPSLGDTSLLGLLLSLAGKPVTSTNLLLFARSGLWADLKLKREDFQDELAQYSIADVLIEVDYDYREQSPGFAVLDVETIEHAALRPLFALSRPDLAGRQHGRGRMSRTLDRDGVVELSTPRVIGVWRFKEWRGCGGRTLPSRVASQAKNPKLSLIMDDNLALQAVYESTDSDEDGLADDWELTRFGNLLATAAEDSDGDGFNNYVEFLEGSNPRNLDNDQDGFSNRDELRLGTDPNNAASVPFMLIGIRQTGPDSFVIGWQSLVGLPKPLLLESSSSLVDPVWHTIASISGGFAETPVKGTKSGSFFRLRLAE